MARINNLTNFLTDVATAIKTKTGDSTAIPASQFDTKIANISTGHLDNTEYAEANDDLDDILEGSTPIKVFPPDWSQIGYQDTPEDIMEAFSYSKQIYDNWDASVTNLTAKLYGDINLKYMPLVNTSNATNMRTFLSSCAKLLSIPQLDTSNVENMSMMCNSSSSLANIELLDTNRVITMNFAFSGCTNLSNKSLNNILAMCANVSSNYSEDKTLKKIGLTSTQATVCQGLSNYSDFIAAGWTTGY